MKEFRPWPKIARLNRDIVVTEKLDGTNAAIGIIDRDPTSVADGGEPLFDVYAQSRTRIITPGDDNFGFAAWVEAHREQLITTLGPGLHFGEWFGKGIQKHPSDIRRFALFNVERYESVPFAELGLPEVVTVPRLYTGPFSQQAIEDCIAILRQTGSAFGGKAEGVVVFHTASSTMFKVTLENDERPKGQPA